MKAIISISIICVFLLTSCFVPSPVVKLMPKTVGKKDYWDMGRQFVCDESNKISYECGYKKMEQGKVVYDVKITNLSDKDILVAPEKFWQMVFKNDTLKIATDQADNPEVVLLNYELNNSREEANAKNAMVIGAVATVATVGTAIAVASSNDNEENKALKTEVVSDAGALVAGSSFVAADESANKVAENYYQHSQLSNTYLRKTTLHPGFYINGEVRFPYNENARWYCVQLGVENSNVDFFFRQVLFYPADYNSTH